jgi:hypothetical protein
MKLFRDIAERHAGWAMAVLHWSPEAAWRATPRDVAGAHAAWRVAHGLAVEAACDGGLLANMMKEFPDG